jgi:hypothetical protein
MSGVPPWVERIVPTYARLALAIVIVGVIVAALALDLPYGRLSNVALNMGSFAVGVGLLLGAERVLRLRSRRR